MIGIVKRMLFIIGHSLEHAGTKSRQPQIKAAADD